MIKRIILLVISVTLVACASDGAIDAKDYRPKNKQIVKDYRVGVDDVIKVKIWRNPDLDVTVPVRPDSKISVPLVGDIVAGGKTAENIARSIEKELKTYIRDPNVTVIVANLRSHEYLNRVRVTGAVNKQVSLTFRQGMTVLDAILAAGGMNDFASADDTRLYRRIGKQTVILKVNLDDILYRGKLETNIEMMPGDIVSVKEKLF